MELINDYKQVEIPKEEEKKKEEKIVPRVTAKDVGELFKEYNVGIEFEDADFIFYMKQTNPEKTEMVPGHPNVIKTPIPLKIRIAKRELKKMFEQMYIDS